MVNPAVLIKQCKKNVNNIKNVIYYLSTRLLAITGFIIAVPFFINHASDAEYGLASIGFSLLTIGTFIDVALGHVLFQSIGRRYSRGNLVEKSPAIGLYSFYIIFSSIVSACGVGVLYFLKIAAHEKFMYVCLMCMLPAITVSAYVAAIFQGLNNLKYVSLSRFFFEISKAVALVISGIVVGDISLIGPTLLLLTYIRASLDLKILKKQTNFKVEFIWVDVKKLFRSWRLARYGSPLIIMLALMLPINIGDKVLINNIFGAEYVALYSIAFDINTKAYLLVNAINSVLLPILLYKHARKDNIFGPINVGLLTVSLLAFSYYAPLFIFAPQVLEYWLGSSFSTELVPLTRVMTLSSVLYLYGNVFENALNAMGKSRKMINAYKVGFLLYIVCIFYSSINSHFFGFVLSYAVLSGSICLGMLIIFRQEVLKA